MAESNLRFDFVNAVVSRIGYPYRWGASGPDAFDCCGLVEWAMNKINLSIGDIRAADLFLMFQQKKISENIAKPGTLWFYSNTRESAKITHVMIMVRTWGKGGTLVGSRGGGYTTVDERAAWEHRAFVDCVMTDYWHNNLVAIVDPFSEEG